MAMNKAVKKALANIVIVLVTWLTIEFICFLFLFFNGANQLTFPVFNREISPYYVYGNSPGYRHQCSNGNDDSSGGFEINRHGFVSSSPVSMKKDSGVLRIVLFGGSAGFGNGQLEPYKYVKEYSGDIYCFGASISGQLQSILSEKYPNRKVEVINGCAPQRMIHQSINYYLETLSYFDPDVVISLDGMNDLTTINGISPYLKARLTFESYMQIHFLTEKLKETHYSQIVKLFYFFRLMKLKEGVKKDSRRFFSDYFSYDYDNVSKADYLAIKNNLIKNSEQFTRIIQNFNALCQANHSRFIFGFQPILYRAGQNKKLSPAEFVMRKHISPVNVRFQFPDLDAAKAKSIETLLSIGLKYFIDDYLSGEIQSLADKNGFVYVDFNQEISGLSSGIEIFTDYCHMTPEGNKQVALILADEILQLIPDTAKIKE
jgi:hypothetical protein